MFRLITILFALLLSLPAMGVKPIRKEIRNIDRFQDITVAGGIDVVLMYGEKRKCVIEAESSIIPHVHVDIEDNSMRISAKSFKYKTSKKITIYLTTDTTVSTITTVKGNHISSQGLLPAGRLVVNARSASNIALNVEATQVDLHISGSSSVSVMGTCTNTSADVSDTSFLWTHFLKSSSMDLTADYYCHCKVYASNSITIRARNGSNVEYIHERGAQRSIDGDNTSRVIKVAE